MLTARYRPDTVVVAHQFWHYPQIGTPVVLDMIHLLFITIFQGFAWDTVLETTDVHAVLNSERIILGVYEHDLAIKKLKSILDEKTLPLQSWILFVATFNGELLISIWQLPHISDWELEDVNLGMREGNISKYTWVCDRV